MYIYIYIYIYLIRTPDQPQSGQLIATDINTITRHGSSELVEILCSLSIQMPPELWSGPKSGLQLSACRSFRAAASAADPSSMDSYRFILILHGFIQMYVYFAKLYVYFAWIYVNLHGFMWISVELYAFRCTSEFFCALLSSSGLLEVLF